MIPTIMNNGLLDAAGAAAFTALVVQQTKFLIEYEVKPTNPQHDNIIRLYVDVVAMTVVIAAEVVSGAMNVHNGAAWFTAVVQGFGVAIAAIAGYHLLNGMQSQTPSPQATVPEPAPALDESALLAAMQRILATSAASALQQVMAPGPLEIRTAPADPLPAPAPLPENTSEAVPGRLVMEEAPAPSVPLERGSVAPMGPSASMSSNAVPNNLANVNGLMEAGIP